MDHKIHNVSGISHFSLTLIEEEEKDLIKERATLLFPHAGAKLIVVREGDLKCLVNHDAYLLSTSDVIFLSPYTCTHLIADHTLPTKWYRIRLSPSLCELLSPTLQRRAAHCNPKTAVPQKMRTSLFSICDALYRAEGDGALISETVRLLSLLEELAKKEDECPTDHRIPLPLALRRILAYLFDHSAEPITAQVLATRYEISKSSVNRLFSEHLGASLHTFLTNVRTCRAACLLESYSDERTALMTGFPDAEHMRKALRLLRKNKI